MSIGSLISNDTVTKDGVVYLASHSNFAYSDGDRAERYVRDVIHGATDVSSDSPELVKYIRDWPSRYHLSRERAHAYRSLAIPADATVLEIGCGCGSITRLLGEKAARVLALEGSARRASITRDRTRDLENVTVLCASFEEVAFQSDFDIVICNGVLEYAALFVRHARPHQRMIELLARLVRPGGSLIVAIENKMGLRYFASGREEHTNVRFDGLEGYAAFPSGPRTFGALELRHLLEEKFTSVETLLPLPDYKIPIALIRAELLDRANCAELFANTAKHDYDTVERPLMHERLVWRELANNGLLRDFANSLFLIAGTKSTMLLDRDWMGDIYSTSRTRDLAVRTTIRLAADGAIVTEKGYLYESVGRRAVDPLRHTLQMSAWSEGPSIHTCVTRALMARSNEPIAARLRWPVELWWRVACGDAPEPTSLTGSALDCNWQNVLVEGETARAIDTEWAWAETIDPAWLVFRSVMKFCGDEAAYVARWSGSAQRLSPYRLMCIVCDIAGTEFGVARAWRAARHEVQFQRLACEKSLSEIRVVAQMFEPMWLRAFRSEASRWPRAVRRKLGALLRA